MRNEASTVRMWKLIDLFKKMINDTHTSKQTEYLCKNQGHKNVYVASLTDSLTH